MINKKDKSYWTNIENVKSEILRIKDMLGKFPCATDLETHGYNMLAFAIQKYHGGFNNIREIFNEPIIRRSKSYWAVDDNIIQCARTYYENYGELKYKSLKSNGHNDFINAIKRRNISLADVCDMIGCEKNFTEKGYLEDRENIKNELKQLIQKYGVYPPIEILLQENKTSLEVIARKKFNGINELLMEIGYVKPNNLSSLEICAKAKIDKIFANFEYVDNGRKELLNYGVNMKNPHTKKWLEIDRYFYNLKLAVEIHGKQHYIGTTFSQFGEDVVTRAKRNDDIKANLLKRQGVDLVIIPYSRCSDEFIRASLAKYLE